jgi:hypothetical protein
MMLVSRAELGAHPFVSPMSLTACHRFEESAWMAWS